MTLPEITEVQRMALKPGDRLIVRVAVLINADQAGHIERIIRARLQLPDEFPILVTDRSTDVEVAEGAGLAIDDWRPQITEMIRGELRRAARIQGRR